ncbi:hypothetical protein IEO21_09929 [Rhodonia placenta]|uniref:Aminoglycoside phosphotransferase domain-containing protein n=1 Tax=Rhodonia placenta TaxID=104341 RepID=A0A8H7NTE0_9APHY|nr:hypothetical protein IEO21_09929 [Postia placenta]
MFLAAILQLYVSVRAWYDWEWRGQWTGRVLFMPLGLVLKISSKPRIAHEGNIIRFVRAHTSIPLPRVLAATEGFGRRFTLMRQVRGDNLEEAWRDLDRGQRASIVEQLRSFVLQLRALPSPHGAAICGLDGAACIDSRVSSHAVGPFSNEGAFNDCLVDAADPYTDDTTLRDIRSRMRDTHRIVFTHGDLAPRNILVRGGTVVAMIDWEESGWFPEHWEFVKAMYFPMPNPRDERWMEAVRDILSDDYEQDWLMDRELSDRMVGAF